MFNLLAWKSDWNTAEAFSVGNARTRDANARGPSAAADTSLRAHNKHETEASSFFALINSQLNQRAATRRFVSPLPKCSAVNPPRAAEVAGVSRSGNALDISVANKRVKWALRNSPHAASTNAADKPTTDKRLSFSLLTTYETNESGPIEIGMAFSKYSIGVESIK